MTTERVRVDVVVTTVGVVVGEIEMGVEVGEVVTSEVRSPLRNGTRVKIITNPMEKFHSTRRLIRLSTPRNF